MKRQHKSARLGGLSTSELAAEMSRRGYEAVPDGLFEQRCDQLLTTIEALDRQNGALRLHVKDLEKQNVTLERYAADLEHERRHVVGLVNKLRDCVDVLPPAIVAYIEQADRARAETARADATETELQALTEMATADAVAAFQKGSGDE